jgi:hypothetical protein
MVINTFQNRQLFVAKALGESSHAPSLSNIGDLGINSVTTINGKEMYFVYKNAAGEILKSDMIPVNTLGYAKAVKASAMAVVPTKKEVTVDENPIAGQDYILRIIFKEWIGAGDDSQYFKDVVVHATSGMSKSDFYKAMLKAANTSFSREVNATSTSNPYLAFSVDNASTATKFIVEEKEQPWTLGVEQQERVYFDLQPTTIYTGADDVIWGTVTDVTASNTAHAIKNGKKIADLEWFCMGERGDQYRMMGYPNYIATQYLVDPSEEYSTIELHFAFTDNGVNSYRSEKDITIAVPNGEAGHVYEVINAIIGEINYHANLNIGTLS